MIVGLVVVLLVLLLVSDDSRPDVTRVLGRRGR